MTARMLKEENIHSKQKTSDGPFFMVRYTENSLDCAERRIVLLRAEIRGETACSLLLSCVLPSAHRLEDKQIQSSKKQVHKIETTARPEPRSILI